MTELRSSVSIAANSLIMALYGAALWRSGVLTRWERERIATVAGADPFDNSHNTSLGVAVRTTTESIQRALGLDTVVVHPREGAAAARAGEAAWFGRYGVVLIAVLIFVSFRRENNLPGESIFARGG